MAKNRHRHDSAHTTATLVEHLRQARVWAWHTFDHRVPGVARDLARALAGLARDHDPEIYAPWSKARALETEVLMAALDLAQDLARAIRKADALQPHLVRSEENGR